MRAPSLDDAPTIVAIGAIAFVVACVSHEALGHGVATLVVGAKPVILTTCYFTSSGSDSHWIPAGGGIANMAVGGSALLLGRALRDAAASFRFFLVLVAAFNLFFAASYPAYSGIALFGDWAGVISGLSPSGSWRAVLIAFSVVAYAAALHWTSEVIAPFCGSNEAHAIRRVNRITLLAYMAAIVTACAAAAFNPGGWTIIFSAGLPAAAASFGLTQMDHFAATRKSKVSVPNAGPIARSVPWIVAAAAVSTFFVGVLGPGILFTVQ
jgi:hypothetical protein